MTDSNKVQKIKKKPGRPRISDAEKRKHGVTCRLTDAEQKHVDKLRGGATRGEFIRRAALGKMPKIVPEINLKAWAELSRSAANLNQIAKNSHSINVDILETLEELRVFRAAIIGLKLENKNEI